MSQPYRIKPGLVDRELPLTFTFNGRNYEGFKGDTLASALLANGRHFVARSFKYHRPRGIFSAGSEEPSALMTLHAGAYQEPNSRATVTELFDGLQARSQNHRGPLGFDMMAVNDLISPFLTAGFYYKTFMWPRSFWEKFYEPAIREAAGLGRLSGQEDPSHYDKGYLHCDLLVIGSGPSGLMAALTAARAGARVILAEEDFEFGGRLNAERMEIGSVSARSWRDNMLSELSSMENVRLMRRCTVYGAYDHGIYGALERCTDHLEPRTQGPRQVLWRIYSKRAILAAGATERPIAFGNNDRPGIMQAGAVRTYLNRYGVAPGKRVALFTNNDDGWRTAQDLARAGVDLAGIVDVRDQVAMSAPDGVPVYLGEKVVDAAGRKRIRGLRLGDSSWLEVDCLAVSGGWNPNVHLTCHQRGKPVWRDDITAFVPGGEMPVGMSVAGAAKGDLTLAACLRGGQEAASEVVADLGLQAAAVDLPKAEDEPREGTAFWHVGESRKRAWLDLQNDVTVKDVKLAHQEGFRSVEHLKRYTTLGMATDQGKTANIPALAVMAEIQGRTIAETGTTIFRPPYTPVPIGAFAGRARGAEFRPRRLPPSHGWAEDQGAVFVEAGQWMRAQWFPKEGETHWRQSVDREVLATRNSVGVCDVSTLGKIDIQGRDAAEFLNRVYANGFAKLPVGKVRYGLMLREDGMVMDDGTTARLAENHYLMTTTTANAGLVYRHLEFCRQCLWPDLDVHLISVTDSFAQYAVAGPNARKLLDKLMDEETDISNEAFPFMACGEVSLCGGVKGRLFRISFSGELAYELAVPARYGRALMEVLMQVGEEFAVTPYGTEALSVMRIEKGHPVGNELTGQTTAQDLGMGGMVSKKKDCIGNVLSERPELNREDGLNLMGFRPVHREALLKAGSHFVASGKARVMENDQGWMTSVAFSPSLGHSIGLGFIERGRERMGEIVIAADPLRGEELEVEIVSPHFIDPEGERLRG